MKYIKNLKYVRNLSREKLFEEYCKLLEERINIVNALKKIHIIIHNLNLLEK